MARNHAWHAEVVAVLAEIVVSRTVQPNTRLKLTAPVIYGRIAFVNVKAWRRSLDAIR
jgi:hypothetical protein